MQHDMRLSRTLKRLLTYVEGMEWRALKDVFTQISSKRMQI